MAPNGLPNGVSNGANGHAAADAPIANIRHSHTHHVRHNRRVDLASDYDTAHPHQVRKYLRTYGLTPPAVESFDTQAERCMRVMRNKPTSLDKFQYLTHLRATNVHLFYRLLANNVKELAPLIYTPTIGEACLKWSEIYIQPEGLYLSYEDKGHLHSVIQNWPHNHVEITVVTDGSRILGLGDLGINGMGIPVGKLALYTASAGIRPDATLPICLDLGTGNEKLRNDPLYMGSRRERISEDEEREFMDEMMAALTERYPGIVIQFEDFKNPFPALERYKETYTCFNDDIQGTGAVILGGFINAVKASGVSSKDHRCVFLGAGSSGTGVAKQLCNFFVKEGLTEEEAKKKFWLVDSKGLVTDDRGDNLAEHKKYFSRKDNEGQQFKSLKEVIDYVKPTVLMGLSTIGGAFTHEIIKQMGEMNNRPIIFPLSNPSDKAECNFDDAMNLTSGRALFASGSPFPDWKSPEGKSITPGQGNNMYVFPGIGLGAILSKAVNVTDEMIYASGEALSVGLNQEERDSGAIYPKVERIREISVDVTRGVIRAAQKDKVDRELNLRHVSDKELDDYIRERMYDPTREKELVECELQHLVKSMAEMSNSRL